MPTTISSLSIPERSSSIAAFLNPWNWVALIYAGHVFGALVAAQLFEVSIAKMALPIGFLVLGFAIAVGFRWYDPASRVGCWKWWLPVAVYALVVFLLSDRSYPEARTVVDTKVFHPVEYLTLGLFLSGAWHGLAKKLGTPWFIFAVQLSGTAYAFSDEWHQAYIPGRTSTFTDVLIDAAGVALGLAVFLLARFIAQNIARERPVLRADLAE